MQLTLLPCHLDVKQRKEDEEEEEEEDDKEEEEEKIVKAPKSKVSFITVPISKLDML